MTDRERQDWGIKHRTHVYWFEKTIAAVAFIVSLFAVPRYDGLAQYFFVGVGSIAAWKLFPSIRPLVSWAVQRMPFLKSEPGAAPQTETLTHIPPAKDE